MERIHGFEIIRTRENEELRGSLIEMRHVKTGARVCRIDNGEENKFFAIAFKTIPENDTGVFHILEHSVLCGSEKYPVKEPFVELLKSSLKTFLNAFTAADFTAYPVSSRNERDYLNLVSVYLDAVFAPAILREPNIFYQEGRHFEENDGELISNGVVFNEMKGAMSSDSRTIMQQLTRMLYGKTCYGFNSGGDPAAIPELTYESFRDTYKRFYHPSNAYVFMDGSVPFEEMLALLDGYFSRYEKLETLPEVGLCKPVSCEETGYYEIGAAEETANRGRLTLGKLLPKRDRFRELIIHVLNDVLAGTNDAPLCRAVFDAGIAKDFSMNLSDGSAQPYQVIRFTDIADGKDGEAIELLRSCVQEIIKEGIDREQILASIDRMEYSIHAPEEPGGLIRFFNAMTEMLYGGDPMEALTGGDLCKRLREAAETDLYETTLRELILNSEGLAVLHTLPSRTLGEELALREKKRLAEIYAGWSEEERQANRDRNAALLRWQQTEDASEDLAKLPVLELSQVSPEPTYVPTEDIIVNGVRTFVHDMTTHGIVNGTFYFDMSDLSPQEVSVVSFMTTLLGDMDTDKHDAVRLNTLCKRYMGDMEFSVEKVQPKDERGGCKLYLKAAFSALSDKLEKAVELVGEILLGTSFERLNRVRETVEQYALYSRMSLTRSGHEIARNIALSHDSMPTRAALYTSGWMFFKWLNAMANGEEADLEKLAGDMRALQTKLFCRERLTVSVVSDTKVDSEALYRDIPHGEGTDVLFACEDVLPARLGIRIPAMSCFSAQAGIPDTDYRGSHAVAAKLLSLGFYWNTVRVRGGAYGTGISAGRDGSVSTFSYRDPSPKASVEANLEAASQLKAFCESDEPVDKYIISTIASQEPLLSAASLGRLADNTRLAGYGREDAKRFRTEILATDKKDLLSFCPKMEAMSQNGAVCVLGPDAQLQTFEDMEIVEL